MSRINLCAPHHDQAIPRPCIRWRENTYLQDSCSDFSLQLVYNNPKPETTPKSADEKMKIEKKNQRMQCSTSNNKNNNELLYAITLQSQNEAFLWSEGQKSSLPDRNSRSLATVILVWYKWRVGTDLKRAWFGDGSQIQAFVLGDWYT